MRKKNLPQMLAANSRASRKRRRNAICLWQEGVAVV